MSFDEDGILIAQKVTAVPISALLNDDFLEREQVCSHEFVNAGRAIGFHLQRKFATHRETLNSTHHYRYQSRNQTATPIKLIHDTFVGGPIKGSELHCKPRNPFGGDWNGSAISVAVSVSRFDTNNPMFV